MSELIFAYEWDTVDLCAHCTSLSNGNRNKEEYLNWLKNHEYVYTGEIYKFPEITLTHFAGCKSAQIDSLPAGSKYVYNIPVKNHISYFYQKFQNGFDISDRVIDDINNGNALITLDYMHEGMLYQHLNEFNKFIEDKLPFQKDRILLLHGDFNVESFKNAPYLVEPVDVFPSWIHVPDLDILNKIINYKPINLFLTYNSNLYGRTHRILLILILIQRNLLKSSIFSLGNYIDFNVHIIYWIKSVLKDVTDDDIEIIKKLFGYYPDKNRFASGEINFQHHENSFVSLICETINDYPINFFSEKIYKPLSIGHPFVLFGAPYQLKRLRNMGFKTFESWWDESYDDIEDTIERLYAIVDLIEMFNKWPIKKLIDIRKEMQDVLEHNQKRYSEIRNEYYINSPIINAIRKHL